MAKYRCKGCGKYLDEKDVEKYDNASLCHVVAHYLGDGDIEPEPCGPVIKILEEASDE